DHQGDGHVEEGVAKAEHGEGETCAANHQGCSRLFACWRWKRTIGPTSSTSRQIATADASGQSALVKNSSHRTLPIISVSVPPKRSGITNSPTAGMKTIKQPATMPASDNGKEMVKNVAIG